MISDLVRLGSPERKSKIALSLGLSGSKLGVEPARTLMVGDNWLTDGGAAADRNHRADPSGSGPDGVSRTRIRLRADALGRPEAQSRRSR